jgi:hypothetical protein
MSLLAAMPGLAMHDTPVLPPPSVVVSFDAAMAQDTIRRAITDVAASFPSPDPWGWLLINRPDVISHLKKTGNDMNLAYLDQNLIAVREAADLYVRSHKKAWQIYETRPPVIEVQGDLL